MKRDDLEKRVKELERRVEELEAQPKEQHTHFHSYRPVYVQPYVAPLMPAYTPRDHRITCGDPNPLISSSTRYSPLTTAGGQSWQ